MFGMTTQCLLKDMERENYVLDDYASNKPRWCAGCGDYAIMTAVQRLCQEEQLPPEKTVFVSGMGCSSRFPDYINTYGFHGLHGRALPVAEGIKFRRPDLHVFVNMGDGDCCSIGGGHLIHAVRYNMNMVTMVHDNYIFGLISQGEVSPTSPKGMVTPTSPHGAVLEQMCPMCVVLGTANVSFVAQAVDWIPDLLYKIIKAAYEHKGFSFVRILQRCPKYTATVFEDAISDPNQVLLLNHPNGVQADPSLGKIFKNQKEHDPSDLSEARKLAYTRDAFPVGILYRNDEIPCYEDLKQPLKVQSPRVVHRALENEFDKFAIVTQ